ncbi:MAG TPA: hypothetical protein VFY72_09120 [Beijerinckiaceae bacterium]|nr:hypothetical protein [Beijerinckiaceae bacterium]
MSRLFEIIAVKSPAPERLDITVHDHIIVGEHGHASLKGLPCQPQGLRLGRVFYFHAPCASNRQASP